MCRGAATARVAQVIAPVVAVCRSVRRFSMASCSATRTCRNGVPQGGVVRPSDRGVLVRLTRCLCDASFRSVVTPALSVFNKVFRRAPRLPTVIDAERLFVRNEYELFDVPGFAILGVATSSCGKSSTGSSMR